MAGVGGGGVRGQPPRTVGNKGGAGGGVCAPMVDFAEKKNLTNRRLVCEEEGLNRSGRRVLSAGKWHQDHP